MHDAKPRHGSDPPRSDRRADFVLGIISLTLAPPCVLVMFMSAASQASASTTAPDAHRADGDVPGAISRVLGVLRRLIDYGKQLTGTMQQHATAPGFALFAAPSALPIWRSSSTASPAACAGPQRWRSALCRHAARGNDLKRAPIRCPPQGGRAPHATGRAARIPAANPTRGPPLARLPTEEKSPPKCAAAPSAPSSSTSAVTSALRPAISTGHSRTKSSAPS